MKNIDKKSLENGNHEAIKKKRKERTFRLTIIVSAAQNINSFFDHL